jgi:hypothetical protein
MVLVSPFKGTGAQVIYVLISWFRMCLQEGLSSPLLARNVLAGSFRTVDCLVVLISSEWMSGSGGLDITRRYGTELTSFLSLLWDLRFAWRWNLKLCYDCAGFSIGLLIYRFSSAVRTAAAPVHNFLFSGFWERWRARVPSWENFGSRSFGSNVSKRRVLILCVCVCVCIEREW